MKQLYTARDAMEAHFLRVLLEEEGIPAAVLGEALATARGDLPMTQETLPSVWVREEDLDRAAGVAATLQRPSSTADDRCPGCGYDLRGTLAAGRDACPECGRAMPGAGGRAAAWECRNCGESVEPQFTACWNCGHERQGG